MPPLSEAERKWVDDFLGKSGADGVASRLASDPATGDKGAQKAASVVMAAPGAPTAAPTSPSGPFTIEIYPADITLVAGEHGDFTATADYVDGPNQIITSEVEWRTAPAGVISIDRGRATAQSRGRAIITAFLDGTSSNAATANVVDLESIEITPNPVQMRGGEKLQLKATGVHTGNVRRTLDTAITWKSSKDGVIDINKSTGLVTAKYVTDMTQVTATDPSGRISGWVALKVTSVKPTGLTISPRDVSIGVGATQKFKVMGKSSDGNEQDETEAVRWEASPPGVVSFDGKGGVTAIKVGAVEITVTDKNNPSVSTFTRVSTTANDVTLISISPDNSTIPLGEFQQFRAVGDFPDGSNQSLDGKVIWSTKDEKIVKIDQDGKAWGRNSGNTTVYAKYTTADPGGGTRTVTGETSVTVPTLKSITIEPPNPSILVGEQKRFKAMGLYSDGKPYELSGIDWIADPIGYVGIDREGRVTGRSPTTGVGKSPRSVVLKAVHKSSSKEAKTDLTVTVAQSLSSIKIDTDNPASFDGTIVRGQRRQFRAIGVYPVGSGKEETRPLASVDWSSDNEKAVSIDKGSGLATALAVGNATLTAEDKNSKIETLINIRVTESDTSSVTAADKGKLPAAVVKPYDTAKAKYQDLLAQVRQLDSIPKLVQTLTDIVADIKKNPNKEAVKGARDAKTVELLYRAVQREIQSFKGRIESAKNHIDASNRALQQFEGRQEVKKLREKGEEQKKDIEYTLDKINAAASLDPIEGVVGMVTATVKRYDKQIVGNVYIAAADELETKLDAQTLKNLGNEHRLAKADLQAANGHLKEAEKGADDITEHLEVMRKQAEDDFDKTAAKGTFKFTDLTAPLQMADRIVRTLAPETQQSATVAAVAITNHIDQQRVSKDSESGRVVFAMRNDAYAWRDQANKVGKQAEDQKKSLQDMRAKALDALVKVKPGDGSPPKK